MYLDIQYDDGWRPRGLGALLNLFKQSLYVLDFLRSEQTSVCPPLSGEPSAHKALAEQQLACFSLPYFIDSKSYLFFPSHFNMPEIEMGLAIDDKKVVCHSLIGGISFPLGKNTESCLFQLVVA